jgi:hypothetical protein
MALGSTQPLTEMSTRNLPGGKGQPARGDDNLTAICEPTVQKMWEPRRLTTLWAFTPCYRDSFTFFIARFILWLWRWKTYVAPKRQAPSKLHSVITQNTVHFIITADRTPNITKNKNIIWKRNANHRRRRLFCSPVRPRKMCSLFVLTQNNRVMAEGLFLHQAKCVPGHWKRLHWWSCSKAWQPTVSVFCICIGLGSNSTSYIHTPKPQALTKLRTEPVGSTDRDGAAVTLGRCRLRISARRQTILSLVVFFSSSRQMPGLDLNLGHDLYFSISFPFSPFDITLCKLLTASLNKLRINKREAGHSGRAV